MANLRHKSKAIKLFVAYAKKRHQKLRGFSVKRLTKLAQKEVGTVGWANSPQFTWPRLGRHFRVINQELQLWDGRGFYYNPWGPRPGFECY
jgi:hypothetical protein